MPARDKLCEARIGADMLQPLPTTLDASTFLHDYIVRCSDGSLYVGHTANVQERVKAHNDGRCPSWTACSRPVELLYEEAQHHKQRTVVRERQLKGWTHIRKLALINGDLASLKTRARRRTPHTKAAD